MKPQGTWPDMLGARFRIACRRLGINGKDRELRLDASRFERPARGGQLRLL